MTIMKSVKRMRSVTGGARGRGGVGRGEGRVVNILNTGPGLITSHYWPSKTEGATGINCFYFSS